MAIGRALEHYRACGNRPAAVTTALHRTRNSPCSFLQSIRHLNHVLDSLQSAARFDGQHADWTKPGLPACAITGNQLYPSLSQGRERGDAEGATPQSPSSRHRSPPTARFQRSRRITRRSCRGRRCLRRQDTRRSATTSAMSPSSAAARKRSCASARGHRRDLHRRLRVLRAPWRLPWPR